MSDIVIQADRESAASVARFFLGNGASLPDQLRSGEVERHFVLDEMAAHRTRARTEVVNTPETADFMAGVPLEAAHQRERWGSDHDAGKSPFDWFWLIGYLAQKAADAATRGDTDKARHHTISTAAALANWHAALAGFDNAMRPGIDPAKLATASLEASRIAKLEEALERTALCLEDELHSRGVDDGMDEDDFVEWLGQDYGRKTIGMLIRLRQARALLTKDTSHVG